MLTIELPTFFTSSAGILKSLIIACAVGSLAINSIGKAASSTILTSSNPVPFTVSMYSSLIIAPIIQHKMERLIYQSSLQDIISIGKESAKSAVDECLKVALRREG